MTALETGRFFMIKLDGIFRSVVKLQYEKVQACRDDLGIVDDKHVPLT